MARNIEVKARIASVEALLPVAQALADGVRKRRLLLLAGPTRIDLDRVEGLGDFVELEVVLREGQTEAEGAAVAEQLLQRLGVPAGQRLAGANLDLLASLDERR